MEGHIHLPKRVFGTRQFQTSLWLIFLGKSQSNCKALNIETWWTKLTGGNESKAFVKVKIDHIYLTSFGNRVCQSQMIKITQLQKFSTGRNWSDWVLWTYSVQRDKEKALSVNIAAGEWGLGVNALWEQGSFIKEN